MNNLNLIVTALGLISITMSVSGIIEWHLLRKIEDKVDVVAGKALVILGALGAFGALAVGLAFLVNPHGITLLAQITLFTITLITNVTTLLFAIGFTRHFQNLAKPSL